MQRALPIVTIQGEQPEYGIIRTHVCPYCKEHTEAKFRSREKTINKCIHCRRDFFVFVQIFNFGTKIISAPIEYLDHEFTEI
jgi:hypothetical protein